MASLCSTPNAPGSSSARLPTRRSGGRRSVAVTTSASNPYIHPVPLLPANARAPTELACLTISNCECSLSAMMYSASSSPSAMSFDNRSITSVYGRIG